MFLDLINIGKVRRAIVYAGLMLAAILLQNIILARVEILGVIPFILPIFAVAVGFFQGGMWGGVFGIILGVLTDISLRDSSVLMTVLFPMFGFFAGALTMFFANKRFFTFFCASLCALAITAIGQMFRFIFFVDTNILYVLLTGGLQVLWAVPFIFAIYFPCRAASQMDLSR